ncbi:MAG: sensor histidine kinase [Pontibacterium sp.]
MIRRLLGILRSRWLYQGAATLFFSVVSAALVFEYIERINTSYLKAQQNERILAGTELLARKLGDMATVIQLLSSSKAFKDATRLNAVNAEAVEALFAEYAGATDSFLQFRWLDEQGIERVRLDSVQASGGERVWVRNTALQDKSNRYYVTDAMRVSAPSIYFSRLDLNVENQQVVRPYQPTIRVAIRTGEDGFQAKGLLILNFDLTALLKGLADLNQKDQNVLLTLVNEEGYWVLHPDESLQWGQDIGAYEYRVQTMYPSLWEAMTLERFVLGARFDGLLASYRKVNLGGLTDGHVGRDIFFMSYVSPAVLSATYQHAAFASAGVFAVFLFIGVLFVVYDYRASGRLNRLNRSLIEEKHELETANRALDNALKQQHALQTDLAESRKLSALGMMVAGVAHELNTPIGGALISISTVSQRLSAFKTAVENGLTKSELDAFIADSTESATLAQSNLERSADIVKRFKRLAIERNSEDQASFSLIDVVTDLSLSLKPALRKSGVEMVVDVDEQIHMTGQPGILSQVLQNLAVNALTHGLSGREGACIIISAKRFEQSMVEISVLDNGCGIPEELLASLFDPFVTTKRASGNTGLGLHFVHQWVTKALQGSITFNSPKHGGACFTLYIPLQLSAQTNTTALPSDDTKPFLVLDD